MASNSKSTAFAALQTPMVDPKTGTMTWTWLKQIQIWQQQLASGFDSGGNLISNIEPSVEIIGRAGTIGSILQNIDENGIVQPDGLIAASDTVQGAVILPSGAISNTLGSAAMEPSTAFDPAGAAAAAQTAAEARADAVAATAQSNAEAFSSNASNLSSGTVPFAQLGGLTVVITTAALTVGGTQGSQTFTNGLLTAQVQAT